MGGTPDRFGIPIEAFHGQNLERCKSSPHAVNATASHDSKRGEDVRARLNVLSEVPEKWRKSLGNWSRLNRRKKLSVDGQPAPDRNEEYLLYQTLIGAWPAAPLDQAGHELFRGRIGEYMVKAVREAKVNSSWINPNTAYEEALTVFIDKILSATPGNQFLNDFRALQEMTARCGAFTSLSQTLLKIASPGVPDFYQGTELWDLTLVDPDNRRPVDFRSRSVALDRVTEREGEIGPAALARELTASWEDGRIKLWLICKALNFRRENRELFEQGDYLPLEASGEKQRNVCAFVWRKGGKSAIVIAPRFFAALVPEPGSVPCGKETWGEAFLVMPGVAPGACYRNVFTGETVAAVSRGENAALPLAGVFAAAPVALLEKVPETDERRLP